MKKPNEAPIEQWRVRMLRVNPADFMVLFTKGLKIRGGWKIVKGLPKDATLKTIAYDPARGGIMMIVESSEYESIPVTQLPEIQQVQIEMSGPHVKRPK